MDKSENLSYNWEKFFNLETKKALQYYNIRYSEDDNDHSLFSYIRYDEDEWNPLGFYHRWYWSSRGNEHDAIWGRNFKLDEKAKMFLNSIKFPTINISGEEFIYVISSVKIFADEDVVALIFPYNVLNEKLIYSYCVENEDNSIITTIKDCITLIDDDCVLNSRFKDLIYSRLYLHCYIFCHVVYRPLVSLLNNEIEMEEAKLNSIENYRKTVEIAQILPRNIKPISSVY